MMTRPGRKDHNGVRKFLFQYFSRADQVHQALVLVVVVVVVVEEEEEEEEEDPVVLAAVEEEEVAAHPDHLEYLSFPC